MDLSGVVVMDVAAVGRDLLVSVGDSRDPMGDLLVVAVVGY